LKRLSILLFLTKEAPLFNHNKLKVELLTQVKAMSKRRIRTKPQKPVKPAEGSKPKRSWFQLKRLVFSGKGDEVAKDEPTTTQSETPDNTETAMDGFIGEIKMFGGNFAPRGWALCDGQLLPIASHNALFSILGTTYGGDGRTTLALPDLRGRVPLHPGSGIGLSNRRLGEKSGTEDNRLNINQIPAHSHSVTPIHKAKASIIEAADAATSNSFVAGTSPIAGQELNQSIGDAGGGQSINNIQPYLGINYIICLEGVFPSRS
jgi:microcystin-dependent protein